MCFFFERVYVKKPAEPFHLDSKDRLKQALHANIVECTRSILNNVELFCETETKERQCFFYQ